MLIKVCLLKWKPCANIVMSKLIKLLVLKPLVQPPLCDEDMTPMHTTMFGAWYGGVGYQQGCPSQEGGPRLIRFESRGGGPKQLKFESASDLLLDLDTLTGLLPLHTMRQTWSYAWVSFLVTLPFLMKSRPRRRLCLKLILHNTKENGVAKTKGTEIIMRRNVTMFPSF